MPSDRDVILDVLRERICLVPPGTQVVLKEKSIGDEFGLSRTPIRQVLQTLSYEGMLEVKAGLGSITTLLRPEDRAMHMDVFRQLALCAANLLGETGVSDTAKGEFFALHGFTCNVQEPTPELFLRFNGRLVRALAATIDDPILSDAFQAAQWRVVRWRTYDMTQDLLQNWEIFATNIARAVGIAQNGRACDLMHIAADAVENYKNPANLRLVSHITPSASAE